MIEYRVIPVTRYIVTRFESEGSAGSCSERGEFNNAETAYSVGCALCKLEHDKAGAPIDSMEFIYPERHGETVAAPAP